MSIRLLDPEVVSKIAAGEVVERPASVVKELVENSIDAGASQVIVEVKGGGVSSIRVSDNGFGIPGGEAELAFQRHATSKLAGLADLENTSSLGFRGEALPSIAQIARVELLTRSEGEAVGTYLGLREGNVIERAKRACPQGTTVTVRGLFRSLPARLKFLKSPSTENGHITDLLSHYSLAFPGVRFSFLLDGRRVLHTPGSGKVRDALVEVYGLKVAQAMLELEEGGKEGSLMPRVSGYISPPSISRASRSYLSFFVNRRWIQSRLLARAVEKAYEGLLMRGKYPLAVVNLSLPPGWVDINVHPTKREVRFNQEPVIFNTVHGAVRRALSEQSPVTEFGPLPSITRYPEQSRFISGWRVRENPVTAPLIPEISPQGMPILRVIGQLANAYIIAEGPDGLYLIDQHAAHERILFEKILAERERSQVEVQPLLEPLSIEIDAKQGELLSSKGEILTQFGLTIEPFGDRTFLVRAVPSILGGERIEEAIKEILDSLKEEAPLSKIEEKMAITLACHNAIRAGKVLDHEEMRALIQQLEGASIPRTCPHGRPTMVHLSSGRLEKEFGRD
ncbi:DNA mismatch repair endonuclease MutL [Chloroflexota bacterium]